MTEEEKEKLEKEVNIIKELDHPNIVKVYGFYQDHQYFFIVTEFCAGGELASKIE